MFGRSEPTILILGTHFATVLKMLTVYDTQVPVSDTAYIAFRVSFFETLERIELADQVGLTGDRCFGFLTEVPFLRSVPPQVQLDCLLETWNRLIVPDPLVATLVDESVIYAACETSARVVSVDLQTARRYLKNGPREVTCEPPRTLSDELQNYHISLPNEGDFLLLSQFQDMPPDDAVLLKQKFGMTLSAGDVMFDLLGRWHVSTAFAKNYSGLLTSSEFARALITLGSTLPQPRPW